MDRTSWQNRSASRKGNRSNKATSFLSFVHPAMGIPLSLGGSRGVEDGFMDDNNPPLQITLYLDCMHTRLENCQRDIFEINQVQ